MYTIGQISEMFGIPISTLRYYDKEGLFPDMQRESGIRQFIQWCMQGSETYPMRRGLFLKQKKAVEAEIERMNQTLDMLKFKCWYYEKAIRDGSEERLCSLKQEDMPEEIRRAYENSHSELK